MTEFEKSVISIVRGALTGETPSIAATADLAEIYRFGAKQQINYLLYTGLSMTEGFADSEVAALFLQDACVGMAVSVCQRQGIETVCRAFDAHGVDYMPLKGMLLGALYPQPEMRSMGDADILIRTEQLDTIAGVMRELGYTEGLSAEHEYAWCKPNTLRLELHKYLVPPFEADMFAFFGDTAVWDHAVCQGGHEYRMTPEDELIFDFIHFVKHFRTSGAGIRNITDFYVFRKKYTELDEAYICARLSRIGLERFYRNVIALCDVWFAQSHEDAVTDKITDLLFSGGIYGSAEMQIDTETARYKKQHRFGGLSRVLDAAFPPYKQQVYHYPVLKKMPFLLPVTWVAHWFVVLFRRPESIKMILNRAADIEGARSTERLDSLESVGLSIEKDTFKKHI